MNSFNINEYNFNNSQSVHVIHTSPLVSLADESLDIKFDSVDPWPGLEDLVEQNVKGLDHAFELPLETNIDHLCQLAAEQLHISYRTNTLQDFRRMHLLDQDQPHKKTLVGHHYRQEYESLDDNQVLHMVMLSEQADLDHDHRRYFAAIQALTSEMMIYDLAYGYIATPEKMRFFHISAVLDSTGTSRLNLAVSPPIIQSERYRILLGIYLHVNHKFPFLRNSAGYFVETSSPATSAWAVSEGVEAARSGSSSNKSNKSRRDSSRYRETKRICFHWKLGPSQQNNDVFDDDDADFTYAVLRTNTILGPHRGQLKSTDMISMVKIASLVDLKTFSELEHEASIYSHLHGYDMTAVPNMLLHTTFLNNFKILCLEVLGRKLQHSDLQYPGVLDKMKSCVGSLHKHNVLHGDIRLRNFYIKGNRIIVANFTKSIIYKVLPAHLSAHEIKEVERLCAIQM